MAIEEESRNSPASGRYARWDAFSFFGVILRVGRGVNAVAMGVTNMVPTGDCRSGPTSQVTNHSPSAVLEVRVDQLLDGAFFRDDPVDPRPQRPSSWPGGRAEHGGRPGGVDGVGAVQVDAGHLVHRVRRRLPQRSHSCRPAHPDADGPTVPAAVGQRSCDRLQRRHLRAAHRRCVAQDVRGDDRGPGRLRSSPGEELRRDSASELQRHRPSGHL